MRPQTVAAHFKNRSDAGRQLADHLGRYARGADASTGTGANTATNARTVVLGLPRGGVVVAAEVARALNLPLDVVLVRRIGLPGHEELAVGALATGNVLVLNSELLDQLGLTRSALQPTIDAELSELRRREEAYRADRPPLAIRGYTVILVDDGLATGATMRSAVEAVRRLGAARVVVAAPVGAPSICRAFQSLADEAVCIAEPDPFQSVGQWYDEFDQTSDDEVRRLLATADAPAAPSPVKIPAVGAMLDGEYTPARHSATVLFAHGSGSSRHSPRNRAVAAALQDRGLGTLLLDLLTPAEAQLDQAAAQYRFNIELLARRLLGAVDWLHRQLAHESAGAQAGEIGIFGASTGAAAALIAAAERPELVGAVVSRGGRPDLAGAALPRVKCPSLFIVGGCDEQVLELNKHAMSLMKAPVKLEVVPGATHLFEEPQALDRVAELAGEWFRKVRTGNSEP